MKNTEKWIYLPKCNSKTRVKIRTDTELKNFMPYYPKCKSEALIEAKKHQISIIK